MKIKLISWNVNGLRAVAQKGFLEFLDHYQPDILCLQEIKALKEQLPDNIAHIPGYQSIFHSADKKGYSGTAIYSKQQIQTKEFGIKHEQHEGEGRVITAEYENFYLVNVYTPNSKSDLARLRYRQQWDADFLNYCKELELKKPVIICGDLNVAHTEIDLKNPKQNTRSAGFTIEERTGIQNLLDAGFIDTFRVFNTQPDNYSWWSYRSAARQRNVGWRIDYFCCSKSLKPKLISADILSQVYGSDHCPVLLEIEI